MESRRRIVILFAALIVVWGLNWTVTKLIIRDVPPIWSIVIRAAIAAGAILLAQLATGQFIVPSRQDAPVVAVVSIFHMVLFAAFMAVGLQYVSVGRSVILGYTTPIWVTPAACLLLKEPMPPRRVAGVLLGICGILVLFNPLALDWSDGDQLLGNGLLLLSAMCWAVSILYIRAHAWRATPFQLAFWQNLLAVALLVCAALAIEGPLRFRPTWPLLGLFFYSGVINTAFGFWASTVVNKSLPATVTSLGLLVTPIVGIASSLAILGERIDLPLIVAGLLILSGIALGTVRSR